MFLRFFSVNHLHLHYQCLLIFEVVGAMKSAGKSQREAFDPNVAMGPVMPRGGVRKQKKYRENREHIDSCLCLQKTILSQCSTLHF